MSARSEENHPHPPADWMFSRFWARIILLSLVLAIAGGAGLTWFLLSLRLRGDAGEVAVDAIVASGKPDAYRQLEAIADNTWNDLNVRCYAVISIAQLDTLPVEQRIALLRKRMLLPLQDIDEVPLAEAPFRGLTLIDDDRARKTAASLTQELVGFPRSLAVNALGSWAQRERMQLQANAFDAADNDPQAVAWQAEVFALLRSIIHEHSEDDIAQQHAVHALSWFDNDESLDELTRCVKDQTLAPTVRDAAIEAIAKFPSPKVYRLFQELEKSLAAEPDRAEYVKNFETQVGQQLGLLTSDPADEEGENGDEADRGANDDGSMHNDGAMPGDGETVDASQADEGESQPAVEPPTDSGGE